MPYCNNNSKITITFNYRKTCPRPSDMPMFKYPSQRGERVTAT